MGRRAKYSRETIAAAARDVVAEHGPRAATIAAIAQRLGAPSGSIYHRYRSRDLLLADLWLTAVERFQAAVLAELDGNDIVECGVRTALFMPRWVRANLQDARLLLMHHREDFVAGAWPEELARRAAALEPQLAAGLRLYCRRRWGKVRKADLRRTRFALLDAPFGAVKPYVRRNEPPPPDVDEMLRKTVLAVLQD